MPVDNSRLVAASMQLRGVAPAEWDVFLQAMREYSAAMIAEMVRSDPALLLRAQGMALAANEIASVLKDAPSLHDKYVAAQLKHQTARPRETLHVAS